MNTNLALHREIEADGERVPAPRAGLTLGEFSCGSHAKDFAKLMRMQGREVTITAGINALYAVRLLVSVLE